MSGAAPPQISDLDLEDLHRRLSVARPARLPGGLGWDRGTDPAVLDELLRAWREDYDWREHEQRICALPWELVGAGERAMRVVHQRADRADAPVVVLLHGWPDSVLRFERVLPLLTGCHVVVPALPGFPFAPPLSSAGTTVRVMASMVADAMGHLGHEHYVVSGGDVGADVAEHLADLHPDRVAALHLTNVSPLHAVFADRAALSAEEVAYLDRVAAWQRAEGGYIAEQSTKPHTLAAGLADSPAGLAAWILEKLHGWSHHDDDGEPPFSDADLLTWISAYWLTGNIGTSFGPYVEFEPPAPYVSVPTVVSAFAHDIKPAPRRFAEQFVDVREWIVHDVGGHFAAWEQPEAYVADVQRAVALGRSSPADTADRPTDARPRGAAAAAADLADAAALGMRLERVRTRGVELQVAVGGSGPTIVLVHGWPHTWHVWHRLIPDLARTHRVLAPDLRGAGGSSRARDGYDLHTLADDLADVVSALGDGPATLVGIDAGAPVTWMAAATGRVRARRLVVIESLLGRLPGAEAFLAAGPPWWFGFHAVPGLAERVLVGHEEAYVDWFLRSGTADGRGVAPATRRAVVDACRGSESLRCGFEHYRAMVGNARMIDEAVADPTRRQPPTMAVGASTVDDALHRQLLPITDELVGHVIPGCGHIVPEDRPRELLALLRDFDV